MIQFSLTECKTCGYLRYQARRLPCLKEKYAEFVYCIEKYNVTIADLNRLGVCPSYAPSTIKTKEVTQERREWSRERDLVFAINSEKIGDSEMALYIPVTKNIAISDATHPARCIVIADIGPQISEKFGTTSRQVVIVWQLLDEERKSDSGTYHAKVSRTYTASMNSKSNLRKLMDGWVGRMTDAEASRFDVLTLAGAPAMVRTSSQSDSSGQIKTRIESVITVPVGMTVPPASIEPITYQFGEELPEGLPEWIVKKVQASPEYNLKIGA